MQRSTTTIKVICGGPITNILWCNTQGIAYDSCNSPADLASVSLNLGGWQGRPIRVDGMNLDEVTRLAAHLRAQGHTVTTAGARHMKTITLELTEEQARLLQAYAAYMNTPPEPGLPRYPFTAGQWATNIILHRLAEWASAHPEQASTHTEAVT